MLLSLLLAITSVEITRSQPLSVVVIHRHGDRNPLATYETDPYSDESHWPEGLGQLTKRGLQRQYELGLWLHQRYAPRYSPKLVRATSTDVDRTLMSAEVTLAGLFPPAEGDRFSDDINWRPIPIHTAPPLEDPVLAMKKPCQKYDRLFKDLLASSRIAHINEINKSLYEFVSNKTGGDIKDVYDIEVVYNALLTQYLANKTLPDWALVVFPDEMKPAVRLRYKLPCYNTELARLKTGLLLGRIVDNFRRATEDEEAHKLLLFSAHDSTLADVLTTMGAFNDEVPPYSSALLMELHRENGDYYVKMFFKNSTGVHDVVLETCDFNCKFESFSRILGPVLVQNVAQWERECGNLV